MNYKSSDDGQGSVFSQPQPNNEDLAIATINLLLGNVLDFLVVREVITNSWLIACI